MKGKVNTTAAILFIIALSIIFGFLLTRDQTPVSDTVEYGTDALEELQKLDDELEEEPQ